MDSTPFYFRDSIDMCAVLAYRQYVERRPHDLPVRLIFPNRSQQPPNSQVLQQMLSIPEVEVSTRLKVARDTMISLIAASARTNPQLLVQAVHFITDQSEAMRGFTVRMRSNSSSSAAGNQQDGGTAPNGKKSFFKLGRTQPPSQLLAPSNLQQPGDILITAGWEHESVPHTSMLVHFWASALRECLDRARVLTDSDVLPSNEEAGSRPVRLHATDDRVLKFWMHYYLVEMPPTVAADNALARCVHAILCALTRSNPDVDPMVCDTLRAHWHKLAALDIDQNMGRVSAFVKRVLSFKFHIAHHPEPVISLLSVMVNRLLKSSKSSARSDACRCIHSLIYSVAFQQLPQKYQLQGHADSDDKRKQPDLSKEWRTIMTTNERAANVITKLLRSIQKGTEAWLKKERTHLEMEIWHLKLTILRLTLPDTFVSDTERTVEALLKLVRADNSHERRQVLEILSTFYRSLKPRLITDNCRDFRGQITFVTLAILQLVKRDEPLSKVENENLLDMVNYVGRCSAPNILMPIIEEMVAVEGYSHEVREFGLRLIECNRTKFPEEIRDLKCRDVIFDTLEGLDDRDLVLAALPVIPYLNSDSRQKRMKHLKLTMGLTRSKFEEVSAKALDVLQLFVEMDPVCCLLPVTMMLTERLNNLINSYQPNSQDNNQPDFDPEKAEAISHILINRIVKILTRHDELVRLHDEKRPLLVEEIANFKWIEVRQLAETLTIHCLLRVSSKESINEQNLDFKSMALRMLALLSNDVYREYQVTQTLNDQMPGYFWEALQRGCKSTDDNTPLDDKEEQWWIRIQAFSQQQWPHALEYVIKNEWSEFASVCIRVWRQLIIRWNWYDESVERYWRHELNADQLATPSCANQTRFLTWLNHLRYLGLCVNSTENELNIKEISKFIEDCCRLLLQSCQQNLGTPIRELSPMTHALLWSLCCLPRNEAIAGILLTALQLCFEDVANAAGIRMEVQRKYQPVLQGPPDMKGQPITLPSFFRLPILTFILSHLISSEKDFSRVNMLEHSKFARETYMDFVKFWLKRSNNTEFLSTEVCDWDSRWRTGRVVAQFLHFIAQTSQKQIVLELSEAANDVLSFSESLIHNIGYYEVDVQEKLERSRLQVFHRYIECGLLPQAAPEISQSGNTSYREVFQMLLIKDYLEKEFLSDVIEPAYISLLENNPEFSKICFRMSYSVNMGDLTKRDDDEAKLRARYLNLLAIVRNVEKDASAWIMALGLPKLLYASLLFQCSSDIKHRILGMELTSALLKSSKNNTAATEIALTLPDATSTERFFYYEKAYQLSSVLAMIYPEECSSLIVKASKAFNYLNTKDRTHLLSCLPPWMTLIGKRIASGKMEDKTEVHDTLSGLLNICHLALDSGCPRKAVENMWRFMFKNGTEEDASLYQAVVQFLVDSLIASRMNVNQERENSIRECMNYIVGSKNGKLAVDLLMVKLRCYSSEHKSQELPADESGRRNSFDHHMYTDTELASFVFLSDVAARMPELLANSHLPLVLQNAIVLFDGVPCSDNQSLGNQMLWYLIEYLALKKAQTVQDLTMMANWQRKNIPRPTVDRDTSVKSGDPVEVITALVVMFERCYADLRENWIKITSYWSVHGDFALVARSMRIFNTLTLSNHFRPLALPILTKAMSRGLRYNEASICETAVELIKERLIADTERSAQIVADLGASLVSIGCINMHNNPDQQSFDCLSEGVGLLREIIRLRATADISNLLFKRLGLPNNDWDSLAAVLLNQQFYRIDLNEKQWSARLWLIRNLAIAQSQHQLIKSAQCGFLGIGLLLTFFTLLVRIPKEKTPAENVLTLLEETLEWLGRCSRLSEFDQAMNGLVSELMAMQSKYRNIIRLKEENGPLIQNSDRFLEAPTYSEMVHSLMKSCGEIYQGPDQVYTTLSFLCGVLENSKNFEEAHIQLLAELLQIISHFGSQLMSEHQDMLTMILRRWNAQAIYETVNVLHDAAVSKAQNMKVLTNAATDQPATANSPITPNGTRRPSNASQHPQTPSTPTTTQFQPIICVGKSDASKWIDIIFAFLNKHAPRELPFDMQSSVSFTHPFFTGNNINTCDILQKRQDRTEDEDPDLVAQRLERTLALCEVIGNYY